MTCVSDCTHSNPVVDDIGQAFCTDCDTTIATPLCALCSQPAQHALFGQPRCATHMRAYLLGIA